MSEEKNHDLDLIIHEYHHWGMGEVFHRVKTDNYRDKVSILTFLEGRSQTNKRRFKEISADMWTNHRKMIINCAYGNDPANGMKIHDNIHSFYDAIGYDMKAKRYKDDDEKIR